MLRRLYFCCASYARSPHAPLFLGGISFAESSFFPIPPDLLLIPMSLFQPQRALFFAGLCTLASVLGGGFAYALGYFLGADLVLKLFTFYGYEEAFGELKLLFNKWGLWIVLMAGITPFPYKLITFTSGIMALNLPLFLIVSLFARGIRFYAISLLLYFFGSSIRHFIETYLNLVFSGVLLLAFSLFALFRFF